MAYFLCRKHTHTYTFTRMHGPWMSRVSPLPFLPVSWKITPRAETKKMCLHKTHNTRTHTYTHFPAPNNPPHTLTLPPLPNHTHTHIHTHKSIHCQVMYMYRDEGGRGNYRYKQDQTLPGEGTKGQGREEPKIPV